MRGTEYLTDARSFYWQRLQFPIGLACIFSVMLVWLSWRGCVEWLIASDPREADAVIFSVSSAGHNRTLYSYRVGSEFYEGTTYGGLGTHIRIYYAGAHPSLSSTNIPEPGGSMAGVAILAVLDLLVAWWVVHWLRAPVIGVRSLRSGRPGVVVDGFSAQAIAGFLATVAHAPPAADVPVRTALYLITVMPGGFTYFTDDQVAWPTGEGPKAAAWTGEAGASLRGAFAQC